jgi:hypothetical protein
VVLYVRSYGRRLLDQLELGIASAWHGAGFAKAERLPDLDKVLTRTKRGGRRHDAALTANETRKWRSFFAAQEKVTPN